jgi:hypothetical protein
MRVDEILRTYILGAACQVLALCQVLGLLIVLISHHHNHLSLCLCFSCRHLSLIIIISHLSSDAHRPVPPCALVMHTLAGLRTLHLPVRSA